MVRMRFRILPPGTCRNRWRYLVDSGASGQLARRAALFAAGFFVSLLLAVDFFAPVFFAEVVCSLDFVALRRPAVAEPQGRSQAGNGRRKDLAIFGPQRGADATPHRGHFVGSRHSRTAGTGEGGHDRQ